MKIAITGGTGFVGGHLVRALVASGHEVALIGRQIGRQTYRRVHTDEQICSGLPEAKGFSLQDCRCLA